VDGGRSPQQIAQLVAVQPHCLVLADVEALVAASLPEAKDGRSLAAPYTHLVVKVSHFLSRLSLIEGCMDDQVIDLAYVEKARHLRGEVDPVDHLHTEVHQDVQQSRS